MSGMGAPRPPRLLFHETRAQATVEMAVVVPVLVVLALIVYNLMAFVAATARFDRVAPDIVLAQGVSQVGGTSSASAAGKVKEQLVRAMEGHAVEIEVTCEEGSRSGEGPLLTLVGPLRTYRCAMRYRPWPSGFSIAGVQMGAPELLAHERSMTVDPWKPGVLL